MITIKWVNLATNQCNFAFFKISHFASTLRTFLGLSHGRNRNHMHIQKALNCVTKLENKIVRGCIFLFSRSILEIIISIVRESMSIRQEKQHPFEIKIGFGPIFKVYHERPTNCAYIGTASNYVNCS